MRGGFEPGSTVSYWEDHGTLNLTAALVPRTGYTENDLGPRNKLLQILQKMLLVPGTNFPMDFFPEEKSFC